MCEKGVNTEQMRLMVSQVDGSLSLAQQWLEQIHHLADHAGLHGPSTSVAQATVLLGEARARLESAEKQLTDESGHEGVTIERV